MTTEQIVEIKPHETDDSILFKRLGMSLFFYFLLLLTAEIIHGITYGEFKWDFGYLLLFWAASAVWNGSTTGCKWAILFMWAHGLWAIAAGISLFLHPAYHEFNNSITPTTQPFYFAAALVYAAWSIVNLKFLLRLLKLKQVRHWTKGTIWGYGILTVAVIAILCSVAIPTFAYYYREGYSKEAIESKYADAIEYLRKAAKDEVPTTTNAPEVIALSQAHPEIVLASIRYRKYGSQRLISKSDFTKTSITMGVRGTCLDSDGNEIRCTIYNDYTRNKNNEWVKIELWLDMNY